MLISQNQVCQSVLVLGGDPGNQRFRRHVSVGRHVYIFVVGWLVLQTLSFVFAKFTVFVCVKLPLHIFHIGITLGTLYGNHR